MQSVTPEFVEAVQVLLVWFGCGIAFAMPWVLIVGILRSARWGAKFHD